MTPRMLMIFGGIVFVTGAAASAMGRTDASVLCFAAGALFGKGYGIWEVRSSDRSRK